MVLHISITPSLLPLTDVLNKCATTHTEFVLEIEETPASTINL
jgi:hypothetical protein